MPPLVSIFAWMAAGFALRWVGLKGNALSALNRFIVWIPLPATILYALHRLHWEASSWVPVSMAWIVFAVGLTLFLAVGRLRGWPAGTIGALVMTGGFGNTSFVGFPLLRAIDGERAIPTAVLADQPGSFLALTSVGLLAAAYFSSGRASISAIVRRALRFPPLWALFLAIGLRPWPFPAPVELALRGGLSLLIPLALISVGAQLSFTRSETRRERGPLVWGLLYKLVFAPTIMSILLVTVLGLRGEAVRVTLLEAAMGPMITGAIIADEHDLDPELCSLMVSAGVPLSLITVTLWAKLFALVGV